MGCREPACWLLLVPLPLCPLSSENAPFNLARHLSEMKTSTTCVHNLFHPDLPHICLYICLCVYEYPVPFSAVVMSVYMSMCLCPPLYITHHAIVIQNRPLQRAPCKSHRGTVVAITPDKSFFTIYPSLYSWGETILVPSTL